MEDIELQQEQEVSKETGEIATQGQNTVFVAQSQPTMWNDVALMNSAWRTAKMLSETPLVPQAYKGNAGSCLIAIDMANRMGLSPIMVMQNSQVVQGNFTWKGSACKGLIDSCGRFTNSEYVYIGEKGTDGYGCYLQAYDKQTDKMVKGATVTIQMAKDEGWFNKNGSKWKTMSELMLAYRSATFFARAFCPQTLMGFYTTEEMVDIGKAEPELKETVKISL